MNLRTSLLIALIFYSVLFLQFNNSIILKTKKGNIQSIQFQFPISPLGSQPSSSSNSESDTGKIQEEITKIQNKIQYPSYALEERLESDCEFSILVDKNRKASNLKIVKECSDKSFDQEFKKVIFDWEFNIPEGTFLKIPVRFRLEK
jgi:outer membrane biosynthesis protein TonB